MPVYNVRKYIGPCLRSLKEQSFRDWECIVVDDGSTDGCAEFLDERCGSDRRFEVIHQENMGWPRPEMSASPTRGGIRFSSSIRTTGWRGTRCPFSIRSRRYIRASEGSSASTSFTGRLARVRYGR